MMRSFFVMIGAVLLPVAHVAGQDRDLRTVGTFCCIYLDARSDPDLGRNLLEHLAPGPPFGWRLVRDRSQLREEERAAALAVRVTPGVDRRNDVVVEFYDQADAIVARLIGKPMPLNRSRGASVVDVTGRLRTLDHEVGKAPRPVTAFSYATIEPLEQGLMLGTNGKPTEDRWDLRGQLVQLLKADGSWTLVDSLADVPEDARGRWLRCRPLIVESIPTLVKLACADHSGTPVILITGGSCGSCFSGVQLSARRDAAASVRDLVKALNDHRAAVAELYSVQRQNR